MINFLLRASHKYVNRDSPIVFRIVFRGQRKDVFTRMGCPVGYWMKNERVVSHQHPVYAEINRQLQKVLADRVEV